MRNYGPTSTASFWSEKIEQQREADREKKLSQRKPKEVLRKGVRVLPDGSIEHYSRKGQVYV